MQRDDFLDRVEDTKVWDIVVIGGGATGLGTAVDAASRGYCTLLLEGHDFGKGTSSRSTKLIHGGVRYLAQGNVSLVREALYERGLLLKNAGQLVHPLPFVIPAYRWWDRTYYGFGLRLYDLLAGSLGIARTESLSRAMVIERVPNLCRHGLRGGIVYYDAQFDDARMVAALFRTFVDLGGTALNYMPVRSLVKASGKVAGLVAQDVESGKEYEIRSRSIVNATGAFADEMRRLDDPSANRMLAQSQGIHLVLDGSFLSVDSAVMIPYTDDGRVVFAIPWKGRTLVGTTDIPVEGPSEEPSATPEEVDFLLDHIGRFLSKKPAAEDILSVFAGHRPLVRRKEGQGVAAMSRDHALEVTSSGLVTITGGKWTTYRRMAAAAVDAAAKVGDLQSRISVTESLALNQEQPLDVEEAVESEMVRTVEDFLVRRTRSLILDARTSMLEAPEVAKRIASVLRRDEEWERQQVAQYRQVAARYLPENLHKSDMT